MTVAYFDCFAGAAGDMIVGSLISAGADFLSLSEDLSGLGLGGEFRVETVNRGGLCGVKFSVHASSDQPSRHFKDILNLLKAAKLSAIVKERAERIFARLARAESQVHGVKIDEVHFHEVGAVDSICDIVGACIAMENLGIERVLCSAIPLGSGMVQTEHGEIPVPAPAAIEMLKGVPTRDNLISGEAITPTAAAVLTELAETFGPPGEMIISSIGYGAGDRNDVGGIPNLLRVFVGESSKDGQFDSVIELSANIDDCSGEIISTAIEKLFTAGCLDAWTMPIFAKKSRPAYMLTVICDPSDAERMENILFRETTTFGIRRRSCHRKKLTRRHEVVETQFGPIRIKIGMDGNKTLTSSPEFSDCLTAAESHGIAVRTVFDAANNSFAKLDRKTPPAFQ